MIESTAKHQLTCPMCGNRFDPSEHVTCESCPFNGGCMLSCCPACGYESPDPGRSRLVGLGSRIRAFARSGRRRGALDAPAVDDHTVALSEVPPGSTVTVERLDGLSESRREQLQAYGLSPGRKVDVVQQSPVTVIRVEHIDLAFEHSIARGIRSVIATTADTR